MRLTPKVAAIAAVALAASGLAIVAAPSATAFTGNLSLGCWLPGFSTVAQAPWPNTANAAQNATISHNLTLNGSSAAISVAQGSSIALSYDYSQGPINGGPLTPIGGADSFVTFGLYTAGPDGNFGTNDDVQQATVDSAVVQNTVAIPGFSTAAFPAAAYTASLTAPVSGAYQVKVKNVKFDSAGVEIFCNGNTFGNTPATGPAAVQVPFAGTGLTTTGPTVTISSVTGQSVTTAARDGNTINVGLALFPGAGTLELCDASGNGCDAVTGTHDGTTGSIVVGPSATTGSRTVKASSGATSALRAVTILGAPDIGFAAGFASPFGAGQVVTVTGSNLDPSGAGYTVANFAPVGGGPLGAPVSVTVNGDGTYTANIAINAAAGRIVLASGFTALDEVTFTVNALTCNVPTGLSCFTKQTLTAQVNVGVLKQTAAASSTSFGAVTADSVPVLMPTQPLNTITVSDARGGGLGWSLTAALTTFSNGVAGAGAKSFPQSALTINPTCSVTTGATGVSDEALQTFNASPAPGTVTLCTKNGTTDSATGSTGGVYTITGPMELTIPAFQSADSYTATMTITLT